MYIAWTNERLWITDDQNSQRQESFNNTDRHGPLTASSQLGNTWVLGSILEVPLFTSDSYGSRRIIHTSRSEFWRTSKTKSSINSCFDKNYECVYKVWCQTVALKSWYLYFYRILPKLHLAWRPGIKGPGWNATESPKTRSQFTPG